MEIYNDIIFFNVPIGEGLIITTISFEEAGVVNISPTSITHYNQSKHDIIAYFYFH